MKKYVAMVVAMVAFAAFVLLWLGGWFPIIVDGNFSLINRVIRYCLYAVLGLAMFVSLCIAAIEADKEEEKKKRRNSRRRR